MRCVPARHAIRDFAEMSSDWLWELDAELRFTWVSDSPMIHAMRIPSRMGMTPWQALDGESGGCALGPASRRYAGAAGVSRFP